MNGHDVFFSFGGHDRPAVGRITRALRDHGLRVFVDEDIPVGHGVSATIEQALASSRVLLVYYSAGYPSRYACQYELTTALLAGQREGNPAGRIVVINPEPEEDHLFPVELADATFARAPTYGNKEALADLVTAVRDRVDATSGPIGDPRLADRPRWITDRVEGAAGFVGRYREQWALHSLLRQGAYPLVREVTSGPVIALVGLAGSGKSALAAAYAWQFGAAYPGGIHWLDLSGVDPSDVPVRYREELRRVARTLRLCLDVDTARQADLVAAISDHLFTTGQAALWVVDDLPPGMDRNAVEGLALPAGPTLHTVLISRHGPLTDFLPTVELGPMAAEDAHLLLRRHRMPDTADEAQAMDDLVTRLGGHPLSLQLAGRLLSNRQGLRPFADQVRHLTADRTTLEPAIMLVRDSLGNLTDMQRLVLQLATLCAGTALPAPLITGVVTALAPGERDLGDALTGLHERLLATRIEDRWEVHAIVREAMRHHLPPVVPRADLAQTTAGMLLPLAGSPGGAPDNLMPHAAALADDRDVDSGTSRALHRLLGNYYQARGEPIAAARHWDLVLASGVPTTSDLLPAARAHLDTGGYELAAEYASRIRQVLPEGDPSMLAVVGLLATALDALGRIDAADPHWDRIRTALPLPDGAGSSTDAPTISPTAVDPMSVELQLGYLRSRRLRGDMRTALAHAETLVAHLAALPPELGGDHLQAVRIELATIQLSTNAQREARQSAESVQRWYHERGLPGHANALSAQSLLAQAWLTLHLLELTPDPADWREATESLRHLRERLRRSHGPMNALTLSTDVEYGYALLCLGLPHDALPHLTATIARLERRFEPGHPLTLRARLLLGRCHAQLGEYRQARDLHEKAYTGLLATLGPNHPDTLHAQYGLGVALVLTGDHHRGREMLTAVRRAAPSSVGRTSDLYAQSVAATALLILPGGVWRLVDRLTNDRARHRGTL
jgi:tetratricopeptide (TPR) repeat protein